MMGGFRLAAFAFALAALAAAVYWPGLNGPLILDDAANLDILRVLSAQDRLTFANVIAERGGYLGGRPVTWLSFVVNWRLAGDDVWSYKLVNLCIHLANGFLVLVLARMLFDAGGRLSAPCRDWCAIGVCAFWMLAPIQVSAVLYVVQRMALLAAFFVLLGLVLHGLARARLRRGERWAGWLLAAALACWPLATLSKQNGALLVVLMLVIELTVHAAQRSPAWPRRLIVACTAVLLCAGVTRVMLDPGWLLDTYRLRDFTLAQRLLTEPRVLVDYALNVLQLPGGSALGLFHDDFPLSTTLLHPVTTLPAILVWSAVPVLAWRYRVSCAGLALAGLLFFLAGHSLEGGPFPLEIYFEHRNYLPSFGLWLSVFAGLGEAVTRLSRAGPARVLAAVALAGHVALTVIRVGVWTSFEGIVSANVSAHPRSVRAQAGAAIVAFTGERLDEGLAHLAAAREAGGPRTDVAVVLEALVGYCLSSRSPPAALQARLASAPPIEDDPYTLGALAWYRRVVTSRRCPGLDAAAIASTLHGLERARAGRAMYRHEWVLHDELARVLAAAGLRTLAEQHLREALERAPASHRDALAARLRTLHAP